MRAARNGHRDGRGDDVWGVVRAARTRAAGLGPRDWVPESLLIAQGFLISTLV